MNREVHRPAMISRPTASWVCALLALLVWNPGCTAPRAELYGPNDASRVIPNIKKFNPQDRKAAANLVRDLESDDPAVRLFAIHALDRMTGDRLGYLYYAEEEQRRPAVQRWRNWLEGKTEPQNAATQPAPQGAGAAVAGGRQGV